MVVSCQKRIVCHFIFLFILLTPSVNLAEVKELTDTELDQITAANLPVPLVEEIFNDSLKSNPLKNSGPPFDLFLNSEFFESAGLVHVNAVNSAVSVQTDFIFLLNVNGVNITLSNVANVSNRP